MKVSEMIEKLRKADPESDVRLCLDEVFVYPEQSDENNECNVAGYCMPFDLDLYSTDALVGAVDRPKQPNIVSLKVTEEAVKRHFDQRTLDLDLRRMEREEHVQQSIRDSHPAVAHHDGSAAVAVMVSRSTLDHLFDLVESCNQIHRERDGFGSHGKLTISSLLAMLAEDAGMVISRPGSWEGSAMSDVLRCHGYV